MADLRQFLVNDAGAVQQTNREFQLAIFNGNTQDVTNGGACCLWTVPAGITWAVFETWGGGGSGGGACCCMGPYFGPESGAYAKRRLAVTAGNQFCICAGGSGCCNQTCCGACGFPSWVNCQANGTQVTCAAGGCGGFGRSSSPVSPTATRCKSASNAKADRCSADARPRGGQKDERLTRVA